MLPRTKITLLTLFFAMCATAAVLTAYLQVLADENVKPADLYAVVERQLGELRGGNYAHAYEYASKDFQQHVTIDQFAAMVQTDYLGMTHVTHTRYGPMQARGRHATIQVYLIDDEGEVIPCLYMMVRDGDNWRIDGARLMPAWPPEARMEGTTL